MTTYSSLRAANVARQKEWDTGSETLTLAYKGNELAGEVGEACNVIKKLERERLGIKGSRDTLEHLAEELADVVICVDLVAMAAGIDMDQAVAKKFNATSEKVGLDTRLAETEMVSVSKAYLARVKEFEDDSRKLMYLEMGGVDNWEWYGEALAPYRAEKDEE